MANAARYSSVCLCSTAVFQANIMIGEIVWRMQLSIRPFAYVLQRISGSHDLVAERLAKFVRCLLRIP